MPGTDHTIKVKIGADALHGLPAFRPGPADADGVVPSGGLVFSVQRNRPGLAHALTARYARGVAASIKPLEDPAASVETHEAAYLQQRAAIGTLLSALLVGQFPGGGDVEPLDLDAVRRRNLPADDPSCPKCDCPHTVVEDGSRHCAGCRHSWVHAPDADRFVGADADHDFGLAVVAELEALGIGYGALAKIATGLHATLARVSNIGGASGVSFV